MLLKVGVKCIFIKNTTITKASHQNFKGMFA